MPFEPPNIHACHVLDLVEEKSGGKVKFERFMGGALGSILEHLDLLSSGAIDATHLHTDQYPQQLPLHCLLNSEQLVTGEQVVVNHRAIRYEIPETKALLDAEQRENNLKMLHGRPQNGPSAGIR